MPVGGLVRSRRRIAGSERRSGQLLGFGGTDLAGGIGIGLANTQADLRVNGQTKTSVAACMCVVVRRGTGRESTMAAISTHPRPTHDPIRFVHLEQQDESARIRIDRLVLDHGILGYDAAAHKTGIRAQLSTSSTTSAGAGLTFSANGRYQSLPFKALGTGGQAGIVIVWLRQFGALTHTGFLIGVHPVRRVACRWQRVTRASAQNLGRSRRIVGWSF